MEQKKAISLMLSYVLLIGIGVGLAIAVWGSIKYFADISPPSNCEEGTTIILKDYICNSNGINLTIKNNGRFNVKGFILTVGNDSRKEPISLLISSKYFGHPGTEGMEGIHEFGGGGMLGGELNPGNEENASFTLKCRSGSRDCPSGDITYSNNKIEVMKIQPYIESGRHKVICADSVISQDVDCPIMP